MQNVQVIKLMLTLSIGELRHFDHLCLGGRIYANYLKIKYVRCISYFHVFKITLLIIILLIMI